VEENSVTNSLNYASVGRRWVASFVDSLIVGFGSMIITIPLGIVGAINKDSSTPIITNMISQLVVMLISAVYYVYLTGTKGQTLGKMALKIKVIKKDSGKIPDFTSSFLRETVGKFISAIVFGVGYLWAIWDKDKQTWHDKIANTVVVKV
jgi:uncharacterized RDD family membrane protein YckC